MARNRSYETAGPAGIFGPHSSVHDSRSAFFFSLSYPTHPNSFLLPSASCHSLSLGGRIQGTFQDGPDASTYHVCGILRREWVPWKPQEENDTETKTNTRITTADYLHHRPPLPPRPPARSHHPVKSQEPSTATTPKNQTPYSPPSRPHLAWDYAENLPRQA